MKTYINSQFLMLLLAILSFSCASDDPEPANVTLSGITETIAENPAQGFVLGTPTATADRGTIIFAITIQTPAAAMAIDANSGELTVANASMFDFETNPTLKATVSATAEGVSKSAEVTINLTDVAETVMASPFAVTIDENPTANQSLGTVSATSDAGASLTYSIIAGVGNATAFAINSTTGELSVADVSQFDFETNPSLSATYEASNGAGSQQSTIMVLLNDLAEMPGSIPFVFVLKTSANNQVLTVTPSSSFASDYTIDWGDGTTDENQTGNASHQFVTVGEFTVSITGDFPGLEGSSLGGGFLNEVKQWGNMRWKTFNGFFRSADGLVFSTTDAPDLSEVKDMDAVFFSSKNISGDLSNWDVSNVESMVNSFGLSENFTADITSWNTSKVINMALIFFSTTGFNQDISGWDVSNVESMDRMFSSAIDFNQELSNWNVGKVTNMSFMFNRCSDFNKDIGAWSVENVKTMQNMFTDATQF